MVAPITARRVLPCPRTLRNLRGGEARRAGCHLPWSGRQSSLVRIRLTILLLGVALAAAAAPARAADDYAGAIALERSGQLGQSAKLLDRLTLTGDEAKHRTALHAALAAFAAADVYKHAGQRALAEATLEDAAKQVDAVRDVYVRTVLQSRLKGVAKHDTGFVHDVLKDFGDAARTVFKWLAILILAGLCVGAVAGLGWLVRRRLKPGEGVGIALADLTADPDKRPAGGRSLGHELSNAIKIANDKARDEPEAELDMSRDLDGSVAVNVRVSGDELTIFDAYGNDQKVDIGPLQFSARDVLGWLMRTFGRPREYVLHGAMAGSGTATQLSVDLRGPAGKVSWTCDGDGDMARTDAINDTAHRVVFEVRKENVSESWPSVSYYRQAKNLLAPSVKPEGREARLLEARLLLERSVSFDPANALARFELGTVLRKLGANREAVQQFEMVRAECDTNNRAVRKLLRAVDYNRAMALCKIDDRACNEAAVKAFRDLTQQVVSDSALDPIARQTRILIFRSSLAAALVYPLEHWRYEQADADIAATSRERVDEIAGIRDEIREVELPADPDPRAAHNQARAVSENALGRALYLLDEDGDVAAFETALGLAPGFGDAHVNMASALVRDIDQYPDWEARIDGHLTRALEASPNDPRALFLRGKLCSMLMQKGDASDWWTKAAAAGSDHALLELGRIAWAKRTDEARLEAIALALRSQVRAPAYDERAELLVVWTGAMVAKVDLETLRAARRVGVLLEEYVAQFGGTASAEVTSALGADRRAAERRGGGRQRRSRAAPVRRGSAAARAGSYFSVDAAHRHVHGQVRSRGSDVPRRLHDRRRRQRPHSRHRGRPHVHGDGDRRPADERLLPHRRERRQGPRRRGRGARVPRRARLLAGRAALAGHGAL